MNAKTIIIIIMTALLIAGSAFAEEKKLKFNTQNFAPFSYKSDIKGYKIGVYGPSNTSKSLEKIKGETDDFTIDLRPDDESGFKKLSKGRVTAVYSNRDVGHALIKKLGLKNIRYAGHHKKLQYYIGLNKKYADNQIVNTFNETFLKLHKQGVIQSILEKYQMEPANIK